MDRTGRCHHLHRHTLRIHLLLNWIQECQYRTPHMQHVVGILSQHQLQQHLHVLNSLHSASMIQQTSGYWPRTSSRILPSEVVFDESRQSGNHVIPGERKRCAFASSQSICLGSPIVGTCRVCNRELCLNCYQSNLQICMRSDCRTMTSSRSELQILQVCALKKLTIVSC